MRFRNPASGQIEEFGEATWLWMLLLGPIYLAYKQIKSQRLLSMLFRNPTYGWWYAMQRSIRVGSNHKI